MSVSSGAVAGDLLEREDELAAADRALDRVASGAGAVLVVRGPAGIGKSELLAAVEAAAQARGFGVLRARGSEFEAEIAFGVARQLFEPMLRARLAGGAASAAWWCCTGGCAGVGGGGGGAAGGSVRGDSRAVLAVREPDRAWPAGGGGR